MNAQEKKAIITRNMLKHISELQSIGYIHNSLQPLRRLENKAHHYAEYYCNGCIDEDRYEKVEKQIENSVKRLFGGKLPSGFFVNSDPRGYALKIENEGSNRILSYIDWGGYSILCPNFD